MNPKKMYAESVDEEFGNWCNTKREHESDIKYILVEQLKAWIAERQTIVEGRVIVSSPILIELLKYISEP